MGLTCSSMPGPTPPVTIIDGRRGIGSCVKPGPPAEERQLGLEAPAGGHVHPASGLPPLRLHVSSAVGEAPQHGKHPADALKSAAEKKRTNAAITFHTAAQRASRIEAIDMDTKSTAELDTAVAQYRLALNDRALAQVRHVVSDITAIAFGADPELAERSERLPAMAPHSQLQAEVAALVAEIDAQSLALRQSYLHLLMTLPPAVAFTEKDFESPRKIEQMNAVMVRKKETLSTIEAMQAGCSALNSIASNLSNLRFDDVSVRK